MTLGETIRELRREKGLSQEQLAERTGLSRQTIYKWESGQAAPDLENLQTLAGALGTTVSRLLGEAPPPSRPDPQDPLDKGARMVKKHWRKGGYVLMACGVRPGGPGHVGGLFPRKRPGSRRLFAASGGRIALWGNAERDAAGAHRGAACGRGHGGRWRVPGLEGLEAQPQTIGAQRPLARREKPRRALFLQAPGV